MDPNTNVAPGIGPTPILSGDSSNSSEATKVEVVAQKAISETKRSSDNCSCFERAWRVIKIPFSLIYRLFAWIFCCRSKKRQDPFQKCPDVISLTILSYLSFPDLAQVCPVSKRWNALANNPPLLKTSVHRDIAFGHLQWTLCHNQGLQKEEMSAIPAGLQPINAESVGNVPFADSEEISPSQSLESPISLSSNSSRDGLNDPSTPSPKVPAGIAEEMSKYEYDAKEFESLPSDIGRLLKSSCPAFPGKRVMFPGKRVIETHMLVRLPKGFTLNTLGMLAKKYFPETENGYGVCWESILKEHGDRSIDKPTWLLMTKDVLPGSRNKTYAEQQTMVATLARQSHAAYEVPSVLEAVACIFAQYFRSSLIGSNNPPTQLFSYNPRRTYTRCKENVESYQVVVGGFAPYGLSVTGIRDCVSIGVAGLRKF